MRNVQGMPDIATHPTDALTTLRAALASLAARGPDDGPGAFSGSVLVQRGDDVVLDEAYGFASRRWLTPMTTATRVDVASVTKLFTSVAVLQQVDAGRLTLEDRLGDLLDLAGTTLSPDITLRHLLSHTSGIADDADEEAGESYEALWEDRPSYSVTTTADFLPQFAHKPPRVAPGEDCRYCNVGYVLAGLVLEKVTGQTYRDYVVQHVFEPLDLTAGFFDMRHAETEVAEGWDLVGEGDDARWRLNIFSYPPIGSPDGGAYATSRDLVRFLTALRSGALLSPELTQAFFSPQALHHADDDARLDYAFGLEIESTVSDGEPTVRSIYKDGINAGCSAMVRFYPAADLMIAVVASSEAGAWDPIEAVDAYAAALLG